MERITEKTLRTTFAHFANVHDWRLADHSWPVTDARRDGAVFLSEYDGWWRISAYVESSPPQNGEPQGYSAVRYITALMPKRELVGAMRFELAIRSAERFGSVAVESD